MNVYIDCLDVAGFRPLFGLALSFCILTNSNQCTIPTPIFAPHHLPPPYILLSSFIHLIVAVLATAQTLWPSTYPDEKLIEGHSAIYPHGGYYKLNLDNVSGV